MRKPWSILLTSLLVACSTLLVHGSFTNTEAKNRSDFLLWDKAKQSRLKVAQEVWPTPLEPAPEPFLTPTIPRKNPHRPDELDELNEVIKRLPKVIDRGTNEVIKRVDEARNGGIKALETGNEALRIEFRHIRDFLKGSRNGENSQNSDSTPSSIQDLPDEFRKYIKFKSAPTVENIRLKTIVNKLFPYENECEGIITCGIILERRGEVESLNNHKIGLEEYKKLKILLEGGQLSGPDLKIARCLKEDIDTALNCCNLPLKYSETRIDGVH